MDFTMEHLSVETKKISASMERLTMMSSQNGATTTSTIHSTLHSSQMAGRMSLPSSAPLHLVTGQHRLLNPDSVCDSIDDIPVIINQNDSSIDKLSPQTESSLSIPTTEVAVRKKKKKRRPSFNRVRSYFSKQIHKHSSKSVSNLFTSDSEEPQGRREESRGRLLSSHPNVSVIVTPNSPTYDQQVFGGSPFNSQQDLTISKSSTVDACLQSETISAVNTHVVTPNKEPSDELRRTCVDHIVTATPFLATGSLHESLRKTKRSGSIRSITSRGSIRSIRDYFFENRTVARSHTDTDSDYDSRDKSYFKKNAGKAEANKKLKTQVWSGVVTIVLVEGINLLPMDDNGYSDPYCKFRMGDEKYKSKYKPKTLNPRWIEQFDLRMFDATTAQLEVSVWDHDTAGKDDIMGRAVVDLTEVKREMTHTMDVQLEDGAGIIRILLTISGTQGSDSVSDLANYTPNPKEREDVIRKYDETDSNEPPKPIYKRIGQGLVNSVKGLKDIGWLQVKVIKAQGLAAADIGGKSDPFCVLELVNSRLQTQTEYKTLAPEWGKLFSFQVRDIHSVLEVTVFDEDRDKKAEFLGKIAIPLLRIKQGERRWFALKDRKLGCRAKGAIQLELDFIYNHVRRRDRRWFQLKDKKSLGRVKGALLLEMDLIFNHFKAAIRTFNPREEKYMQPEPKFKIPVMKRNIDRVSRIAEDAVEGGKFIQSCFDWESKPRSITAFIVFLVIVWNFELYMVPITLLIVFFKNLLVVHIAGNLMKDKDEDEYVDEEDDDEEEEKDKEEKKSFKEKLQQIQEVCLQVQEGMDMVASGGERVKNTFNWTVPWLSWLAIIVLSIGTVVLYFVPLRYLILAWGINKFTKKLRAPNAIPNNELLDYLSRVPSDKELIQYRELRPDPGIGTMKKKRQ